MSFLHRLLTSLTPHRDPDKPRPKFRVEFFPDFRKPLLDQMSLGHILVVDDAANIARLIQINLERHGYVVRIAQSGADALAKIREDRPRLLITDDTLPDMSGLELIRLIREDSALVDLPVILLTSKYGLNERSDRLSTAGADMYLTKPFNPAELLAFMKRILSSGPEDFIIVDI